MSNPSEQRTETPNLLSVFLVALRLGLTSFGGPVAHIGYFRDEYVARRKWLDERSFADLVALSQLLPGPASSQLGIAIGTRNGGVLGGFLAWIGFTLPSAIALMLFAYGIGAVEDVANASWLHGLKVMVVAVVALAVWSMARSLCPDRPRAAMAIGAAAAMLLVPGAVWQIAVIVLGGVAGWVWLRGLVAKPPETTTSDGSQVTLGPAGRRMVGSRFAMASIALFATLLVGLPIVTGVLQSTGEDAEDPGAASVFSSFYRSGSLVFGGGHVVLPLLESETVRPGWIAEDEFVAGYAAAQAVPGPLFTFAAYLGTRIDVLPTPWLGGLLALGAIFLPSFLLIWGALPFWDRIRANRNARSAIMGINAGVVGLLLAALYDPLWTSAIHSAGDFALALALFALLAVWRIPPWLVVGVAAAAGWAIGLV